MQFLSFELIIAIDRQEPETFFQKNRCAGAGMPDNYRNWDISIATFLLFMPNPRTYCPTIPKFETATIIVLKKSRKTLFHNPLFAE
jgi:hypothetical protein